MEDIVGKAKKILKEYKKDDYAFGLGCLDKTADFIRGFGEDTLMVISESDWAGPLRRDIDRVLDKSYIKIKEKVDTCPPNSPSESVLELARIIERAQPSSITCVGGGSALDCAKCANVIASLTPGGRDIERFFGVGKVTEALDDTGRRLIPFIAVQVASGSGSHLTKYSNITMTDSIQKKLISDDAVVPDKAVFDYSVTKTMPLDLTLDGALDGLAHSVESYFGTKTDDLVLLEKICLASIELIVKNLPLLKEDLKDETLREKIGLATDLGGYAIMIGSTNGAHLNSFSLVDALPHGRACAILEPYYTVFFSPAIRDKLIKLLDIYRDYIETDIDNIEINSISSRELGEMIARGMINFSKRIGFPTTLSQVGTFRQDHVKKALEAAKNPQLEMKLKGMPIALRAQDIDKYMGRVLESAVKGDFSIIKNMD